MVLLFYLQSKCVKKDVEQLVDMMPKGEKLYIMIDIDGIDLSIAPETGTPSQGGLQYDKVNELLRVVAKHNEVVAFD
ncbi:arginase family protein [Staphylococcus durrellii]|uniref:arginase family protein n=1 Tax=Staphylococcus durrellii TaxID=2781773 RepID=UPI001F1BFADB|nr:arginase family protein [Staphylococcus durrellii]